MTALTAGTWRASPLAQSTPDWPFDWVAEITTVDPATRSHRYVATVHQSGARPLAEAHANVRAMTRAPAMLHLLTSIAHVLDMSDPKHPDFADSAADCLDELLRIEAPLRALLTELAPSADASAPIQP